MKGGKDRVHDTSFEQFPLTITQENTSIVGTGSRPPRISLDGAEDDLPGTTTQAAILVDGVGSFRLERIHILGTGYDMEGHYTIEEGGSGLAGLGVRDLPAGSDLAAIDCKIDDLFNGIQFVDTPFWTPGDRRVVTISNTLIHRCGPWGSEVGIDRGHAGIRLIEAVSRDIDLYVSNCEFKFNHDALEPEDARLMLTDSVFLQNENGLEYATTPGGMGYVLGCTFELNHAFLPGPEGEGGVAERTGGIVARYASSGYDLTVRDSDFVNNQLGVSLKSGPGIVGTIDFGDGVGGIEDHIFTPPVVVAPDGNNTFTTDTKCPWEDLEKHRIPFCGMFTTLDITVQAVGNTWTYVDVLDPPTSLCIGFSSECPALDCGQGVSSSGMFTQPNLVFGPDQNYDAVAELPYERSLDTDPAATQINTAWNLSTGTEVQPGLPSIRLTVPCAQERS